MCANCFLWIAYSLLKGEPTILYANSVGLALGLCYFYIFRANCNPTATGLPGTIHQHIQGTAIIVAFTLLIAAALPKDTAAELIGKMAVVFCVILFASPLSVLKEAILTKSAKNIPLPFAVASTCNTFLWSVSGVLALHDFNVYFPNLLGLACCIAQLVVILMYKSGSGGDEKDVTEVELPLTR